VKYVKKDVAPGPGEEKKTLKFFKRCRGVLCDPSGSAGGWPGGQGATES